MSDSERREEWLSTDKRHLRASPALLRALDSLMGAGHRHSERVVDEVWLRYVVDLDHLPPRPSEVNLEPMGEHHIDQLRSFTRRVGGSPDQVKSALRFWEVGLHHAYAWTENGEMLCMQWLLTHDDQPILEQLPLWSGLYPPIAPDEGRVENIFTFPKGHERRGGAATALTLALFHEARKLGLKRILTHIYHENLAAHRWARRCGLKGVGTIHRYHICLPRLRRLHLYTHTLRDVQPLLREVASRPDPTSSPG